MTPEDHQQKHLTLHRQFDELLACYLSQRLSPDRSSIHDEIYELMCWSHAMTQAPCLGTVPPSAMLIAQNDDPELLEWLANAQEHGGGFVCAIATAALCADHENYPELRPFLLVMRKKYPQYEPSDAVKAEIRRRPQ